MIITIIELLIIEEIKQWLMKIHDLLIYIYILTLYVSLSIQTASTFDIS